MSRTAEVFCYSGEGPPSSAVKPGSVWNNVLEEFSTNGVRGRLKIERGHLCAVVEEVDVKKFVAQEVWEDEREMMM